MCVQCGRTGRNCQWPHGSAVPEKNAVKTVVCPSCGTLGVDGVELASSMRLQLMRLLLKDMEILRGGLRRSRNVVDAARAALKELKHVEVFVTSRQKIKSPEGEDLYREVISELEKALFRLDGGKPMEDEQ